MDGASWEGKVPCGGVPVSSSHAQRTVKDPSGVCPLRQTVCHWKLPGKALPGSRTNWKLVIGVLSLFRTFLEVLLK